MIKSFLKEVGEYCLLMRKTFSRPDNWRMVLKQVPTEMAKLGVDSVGIILIISVFMGVIMTMQVVLNTENPMLPRYTTGLMLRDTYLLEFSFKEIYSSSLFALFFSSRIVKTKSFTFANLPYNDSGILIWNLASTF